MSKYLGYQHNVQDCAKDIFGLRLVILHDTAEVPWFRGNDAVVPNEMTEQMIRAVLTHRRCCF